MEKKSFRRQYTLRQREILLRILKKRGNGKNGRKVPSKEKSTGINSSLLSENLEIKHFTTENFLSWNSSIKKDYFKKELW